MEPIGSVQRAQVLEQTELYIDKAEHIYKKKFLRVAVEFDLGGRTAGMYKVVGRHRSIRYNPWIFAKYFDENLSGTVPHEVAHFAIDQVYGLRRVKPHGLEWQALMADFGADAGVTFDLDLSGIPQRRQLRHRYHCPCRLHEVSATRHNRIIRGKAVYHCLKCRGKLVSAL
ncbi:MAG: SprT-like domain-containing protein [Proteobacteria bacterium]|nr:SprT-like domain-containing protein [Pseudomonadota bacterium]